MNRLIVVLSLLLAAQAAAQPTPEPTPAEPAPTEPTPAARVPTEAEYRQQIDALEARVAELKDEVFRTKSRLEMLDAAVQSTAIAGAAVEVVHRNEMGSSFALEKVVYRLDGTVIFEQVDADGALDRQVEIPIHRAAIVPGSHTISVTMVYRGDGFGIFSYLRSYVFTLRASHTFHVDEGKRIRVTVVGYEKGGASTSLEDRPDIRFEDRFDEAGLPAPDG